MRFRLEFDPPADPPLYIDYGWEPFLGFWAELRTPGRERPVAEHSALSPDYDRARPLVGVLAWLVQLGAFTADDLDEALLAYGSPELVHLSRSARRALAVVENFKRASD